MFDSIIDDDLIKNAVEISRKARSNLNFKDEDSVLQEDKIAKLVCYTLQMINNSISHQQKMNVVEKNKADFVTSIDFSVQSKLIEGLKNIEDIPCLAEEKLCLGSYSTYWVIDPIDGTTNFMHQYPSYCIAVARVENSVTTHGFVYDLPTKTLYFGIKDKGSFMMNTSTGKGCQLSVSRCAYISDALIGFGCPYDKTKIRKLMNIVGKFLEVCHDVKRKGPASLDICYVAAGWLDGYFEYDLKEWDYKAGKLILEEAGGKITDWTGQPSLSGTNNILASNILIHDEMEDILFR